MSAFGILDKQPQEKGSWTIEAFSDAADRISFAITAKPFGWLEEEAIGAWTAHDKHLYDGSCAICKAPYAPGALRVVIDAVLDAALADPDIAAALAERLAVSSEVDSEH